MWAGAGRHQPAVSNGRSLQAARRRAAIEGRSPQSVGPHVALGSGGFADDTAPADALVAVRAGAGCIQADADGWVVAETHAQARRIAGAVPGRRTTARWAPPLGVPPGDWSVTLRTNWVDPAYLETDAAWCAPGGEPASPLGNGGAFGGKRTSPVAAAARRLADRHGRPVRVLWSRPDATALGSQASADSGRRSSRRHRYGGGGPHAGHLLRHRLSGAGVDGSGSRCGRSAHVGVAAGRGLGGGGGPD